MYYFSRSTFSTLFMLFYIPSFFPFKSGFYDMYYSTLLEVFLSTLLLHFLRRHFFSSSNLAFMSSTILLEVPFVHHGIYPVNFFLFILATTSCITLLKVLLAHFCGTSNHRYFFSKWCNYITKWWSRTRILLDVTPYFLQQRLYSTAESLTTCFLFLLSGLFDSLVYEWE